MHSRIPAVSITISDRLEAGAECYCLADTLKGG